MTLFKSMHSCVSAKTANKCEEQNIQNEIIFKIKFKNN